MSGSYEIINGDAETVLASFDDEIVQLTITSPPYFRLRDYGVADQIGQEKTVVEYVARLEPVLTELLRVTSTDGTCFIVIGDTYRDRCLQLVPHRIALAAIQVGWTLRNDIIFHKLDPPPESVRNRWRAGHEHILFLSKTKTGYVFNDEAIRVPHSEATMRRWGNGQKYGGNKSKGREENNGPRMRHGSSFSLNRNGCIPTDVWSLPCGNNSAGHYAAFSGELVKRIVLTCSREGDTVLDPFAGSGTTCRVASAHGRRAVGIELNLNYAGIAGEDRHP